MPCVDPQEFLFLQRLVPWLHQTGVRTLLGTARRYPGLLAECIHAGPTHGNKLRIISMKIMKYSSCMKFLNEDVTVCNPQKWPILAYKSCKRSKCSRQAGKLPHVYLFTRCFPKHHELLSELYLSFIWASATHFMWCLALSCLPRVPWASAPSCAASPLRDAQSHSQRWLGATPVSTGSPWSLTSVSLETKDIQGRPWKEVTLNGQTVVSKPCVSWKLA